MAKAHPSLLQPRQLAAIVVVARTGSMHSAARELGIPQPALSRLIAASEKTLGVPLFERSRSGTRPTEAGERVLRQGAFALRALEGIAEAARESLPVVRVGCIPRVMHVLIPYLLAQLSDGSARFRLRVSVGTSNELVAGLDEANLDFVIGRRAAPGVSGTKLDAEKLYTERTVVVGGRDNPLLSGSIHHIRDLVGLPWVLPKRGFHSRDLLDALIAECGLAPIAPVIESNSFESSLSVVAVARFMTIAPEFAARRFERLSLVRIVRMRPSIGQSPIMLQYRPEQRSHPAFAAFRAAAISAARKVHTH
ncbi:MAG TPA: LysR family transcriptional regulator [Casimicrobiaceae bacterium]|nr:LysR family transcriptional regulator [Casimicrobiaceae bacterium]